ncbi:MAG: TlpA disulfide reductase family protein [Nocardioides sp.]
MKRAFIALVLVLVAVLAVGTSCDSNEVNVPKAKGIDVDTPALVKEKQAAGIADCTPGTAAPVSGGLPAQTLPCFGGGPDVDLATLRGPMLVSLWAYWCTQCRDEIPILQRFYDKYADQVALLGIDYLDPQTGGAMALLREKGATYPSVADPYGDLSAQKPFPVLRGLPYLAFVDADGQVTYLKPGAVASDQELVDLVEQHLGVTL